MKIPVRLCVLFVSIVLSGCSPSATADDCVPVPKADIEKTRTKAKEARTFCTSKNYNTSFCILIDMSLHSGINRFFVWDFEKDTITHSCLVGHGCGDGRWGSDESKDHPVFSNKDGSHCSALGKYKLGKRGYSNWGIHVNYLMHGLEATNSNALARTIVFHSWDDVMDEETYPDGTVEGWGCPTISNKNMKIMDPLLEASEKPVLMWIYKD